MSCMRIVRELRSHLHYKIILPFLLLTLLVAVAGSTVSFLLIASSAQERVSDMAGSVQEHVGDMAGTVMHRTQHAPGQIQRMIEERPLTAAAIAASLGAAVGLWLPTTQAENQLMGKAHDQAMDKVQQVASDTIDKVEDVAQEVRSTAREEARSKGLTV